MTQPQKINDIIQKLKGLLVGQEVNGIGLTIDDDGYVDEGDWVYLIVTPKEPGVRAYAYVEKLDEIERKLRNEVGEENLMLVPAMPD